MFDPMYHHQRKRSATQALGHAAVEGDTAEDAVHAEEKHAATIVTLNVGGHQFMTTIATLSQFDGPLRAMFSGKFDAHKMNDGSVFVDRDGSVFGIILNYMRSSAVDIPPSLSVSQVQTELDYFFYKPPKVDVEEVHAEEVPPSGCELFKNTLCYHMLAAFAEPLNACMQKGVAIISGTIHPRYSTTPVQAPFVTGESDLVVLISEPPYISEGIHGTLVFYYGQPGVICYPKVWRHVAESQIGTIFQIYDGKDRSMTLYDVRTVLMELFKCDIVYISCSTYVDGGDARGGILTIRVFYKK